MFPQRHSKIRRIGLWLASRPVKRSVRYKARAGDVLIPGPAVGSPTIRRWNPPAGGLRRPGVLALRGLRFKRRDPRLERVKSIVGRRELLAGGTEQPDGPEDDDAVRVVLDALDRLDLGFGVREVVSHAVPYPS